MVFLGVCRAIYDYQPQSDEELEIKDGDLLFILEKSTDDDWWKCKKKAASDDEDEPEGLVPNNYVEEAQPLYQAKALYDYTKQTDEELSFKEDTRLEVYDVSDPDWTLVGSNGEYGFAPAIYIEDASAAAPAAAAAAPQAAPVIAAAPQQRELAPPPMPTRPVVYDEPIPGEEDYPGPGSGSPERSQSNPAAALAGIIAQKTGGAAPNENASRTLASPPLPTRPQFTPEESDEEPAPPLPRRPESQTVSSPPLTQYASSRSPEPAAVASPPSRSRAPSSYPDDGQMRSPGTFHMYNIHEMVSHMGKNKKMPTTLGLDPVRGLITISPEKSRDGPSNEWTADKLTHYSIEGKHVFVELVRPSRSIDFHAGAKDTAQEIVAALGEMAGAVRAEGLREVIAASSGSRAGGLKQGKMLYEFMAQGDDEVTVAEGDEVIILDDVANEEWWKVRRLKNGREGVVPSSYVEVTGKVPGSDTVAGLASAKSMAESNRQEEERLAMEAVKKDRARKGDSIPERNSSLTRDLERRGTVRSSNDKRARDPPKSKPNSSHIRTWTDRSGTFKVEAEFIGLREGKIHLHKLNGVKIAVPVAKMAVEDLEYVERATGASLDEDKPLSDIKRRSTLRLSKSNGGVTAGASIEPVAQYDWFDFFLSCGVNPQICERYAGAFSRDQMGPEILPEVNEKLLRTLGLKEGDILRVMKHLDAKFDRKAAGSPALQDDAGAEGGLFSGPGGALKNNTRKGRPAPAVQTNDTIDEAAFKPKTDSPAARSPHLDVEKTASNTAAKKESSNGFDDDAWDVKPVRSQPGASSSSSTAAAALPSAATTAASQPRPVEPPKLINDDIASLAITAPPLQPTPTAAPVPPSAPAAVPQQPQPTVQAPVEPARPQGADQAIFDKIASLAPQAPRQRPAPPMITQPTGGFLPPPPRAASAPGFNQQQASSFNPPPLQPQLTGYLPQIAPPGQSLQDLQRLQQLQGQAGYQQPYGAGFQSQGGFVPQPTGLQPMQQNFPALQPQPTAFQPQGQFGQQQQLGFNQAQPTGYGQTQPMGFQPQPTGYGQPYQQGLVNGTQTGSPFSDPPRQPFQPSPSNLSNSFGPGPTGGFQPSFTYSQPTGMNGGFGAQPTAPNPPQLPPQQTGGVFGPSQPIAPLVPQKTGPAPPVRFGVNPAQKALVPQPTGRANLAKATPQNPFGF